MGLTYQMQNICMSIYALHVKRSEITDDGETANGQNLGQ